MGLIIKILPSFVWFLFD